MLPSRTTSLLWSSGTHEHKPCWLSELIFGALLPQVGTIKVGVTDAQPEPFILRETLGVGSSLLIVWRCAGARVYGTSMSLPFQPILKWIFCPSPVVKESLF